MQRDRWPFSLLAREATKNLFSRSSRLLPVLLFAIAGGLGQTIFLAGEAQSFRAQLSTLALSGRNVIEFASPDQSSPSKIERSSCEHLATEPGVERAGLIMDSRRATFLQFGPAVPIELASASLFPELHTYPVVVGKALTTSRGPIDVADPDMTGVTRGVVGQAAPRGLDTDSAIVYALGPDIQMGSRCVAILSPESQATTMARLLQGELRTSGGAVVSHVLLQLPVDPVVAFLDRPERFAPLLFGLVGGVLGGLINRLRASELATYRLAGTSPRSLLVLLAVEQGLIAGALFSSATLASIGLFRYSLDVWLPILWSIASGALWMTSCALLSATVALRDPAVLAKDR